MSRTLRIAFYMPFKPLGHPRPSGDLVIGSELFAFLRSLGHDIRTASRLRCRWCYWKPWLWAALAAEILRSRRWAERWRPDIWLTYHSYYKAPDLLGPSVSRPLGIPYALFQGIYSTRRKRRLLTAPGFYLNRHALLTAEAVMTNKRMDHLNLLRLIPESRLHYIAPGILPEAFSFDLSSREELRRQWEAAGKTVILTAAMFRPGVKTDGILQVIRACGGLKRAGIPFELVIVGDGENRRLVLGEAERRIGGCFRLAGGLARDRLYRYYSAGDVFVFPGIREGLGMVYLEAQACGLPVVAFRDWGASEAVIDGETGLLCDAGSPRDLENALRTLIERPGLRRRMGESARIHARLRHDLRRNYAAVDELLRRIAYRERRP